MNRSFRLFLPLGLLSAMPAQAQTCTGGISGTLQDPSGALLPSARLTITNLDTNDLRSQTSNENGAFVFAAVPAGRYRPDIKKPGFKKLVDEPIAVRVQQFVTLNLALEISPANQTVEVTGQLRSLAASTNSLIP